MVSIICVFFRNELICVAPLLGDVAIANRGVGVYKGQTVSHHFQVFVSYQGHKAASAQEIIVERQLSGTVR